MPELLVYWIREREEIRKRKEAGEPKPWTNDPTFQDTYFCNVHREDDKVTRWIRENYTPDYFGENYELAIVASRIFNRPRTLEIIKSALMDPDFPSALGIELRTIQGRQGQIWSGAYVITTHGMKMPKLDYCVELLDDAVKNYLPIGRYIDQDTCLTYYHWLKRINGLGSFLSAQVVADLKNTTRHPLHQAVDWHSFSAPGPGSLRGLSWYFGRKVTTSMYPEAIQVAADELGWIHCMQDLQNCMCEFDKYCRVLSGTGRSKRKYAGKS